LKRGDIVVSVCSGRNHAKYIIRGIMEQDQSDRFYLNFVSNVEWDLTATKQNMEDGIENSTAESSPNWGFRQSFQA